MCTVDITDAEVVALVAETKGFMLASHFMCVQLQRWADVSRDRFCGVAMGVCRWSMWAVIQAKMSTIPFGYLEYARDRLAEYRHTVTTPSGFSTQSKL